MTRRSEAKSRTPLVERSCASFLKDECFESFIRGFQQQTKFPRDYVEKRLREGAQDQQTVVTVGDVLKPIIAQYPDPAELGLDGVLANVYLAERAKLTSRLDGLRRQTDELERELHAWTSLCWPSTSSAQN